MTIGKVPAPYVPLNKTVPSPPPGGPGRATPRPSLGGVLAPNQRPLQWDEISRVAKPFPNPDSKEFGFWFNYFWAEAIEVPNLAHAQKVKIQEAFFTVFEPNPAGGYKQRADFATLSSSAAENVLRQLLLIGFRRVAVTQPPPATKLKMASFQGQSTGNRFRMTVPSRLIAQDARELNFIKVIAESGPQIPLAFRADGRDEDKLLNGFVTRARESSESEEYKKYGLDQPWHPFNNPVYKDSLFLRIGAKNRDNCLNTVISVGQRLRDISHFPILSDYVLVWNAKGVDGQFLAIKPFDTWGPGDIAACESHWREVRAVKAGNAIDHLAKRNFMYVFHTSGLKGVNTQGYFGGDAFNERGMQGIPRSHLLAVITFHQKWYYRAEKGQIEIYEVDFEEIRWLQGEGVFDVLLGVGGRQKVETAIRAEIATVAAKYAADKHRKEHPPAAVGAALSPTDRTSITAALGELYNSNKAARGNVMLEKQFVSGRLPALASRIAAASNLVWSALRPKAAPAGFAPPPPLRQ
ncbi:MAG: hypothetical protein WBD10_06190 [Acidobacteriaceae bacterium]